MGTGCFKAHIGEMTMQTSTVVAVVIVGVLGVGVGLIAAQKIGTSFVNHPHKSKDCSAAADCKIDITITCSGILPPKTCEAYPDDAEIAEVTAPTTKTLIFNIQTSGYSFNPQAGIKFTTLNGGDTYFTCALGGQPDKYKCDVSATTKKALYKYSLYVDTL